MGARLSRDLGRRRRGRARYPRAVTCGIAPKNPITNLIVSSPLAAAVSRWYFDHDRPRFTFHLRENAPAAVDRDQKLTGKWVAEPPYRDILRLGSG